MIGARVEPSIAARLAMWLATGLGVGLATPIPGTVGGAWGLLLVPVVAALPGVGAQLAAIAVLAVGAAVLCELARRALDGATDPRAIVLDEIVALPLVFVGVPLSFLTVALGFALFRFFDGAKPWPIPYAERFRGGVGIVADDLAAAVAAGLALQGVMWLDRAAGWHLWAAT